jgi:multimeric flavodoxin WrbA
MKQAIAINGSPEKDGHTARLLSKLDIPIYHLQDDIDAGYKAILNSDVVVFGTPAYWFNVSHLMKQLFDKMEEAPKYPCENKVAFFLAVCDEDGGQKAINQMFGPLNHMGFWIPPYACYIYNNKMADKSEDKWMKKGMSELKRRLRARPARRFSIW